MRGKCPLPFGGQLDQGDGPVRALKLRHELKAETVADMFADRLGRTKRARLGNRLEDERQVAHRHTFVEQEAQDGEQ